MSRKQAYLDRYGRREGNSHIPVVGKVKEGGSFKVLDIPVDCFKDPKLAIKKGTLIAYRKDGQWFDSKGTKMYDTMSKVFEDMELFPFGEDDEPGTSEESE